MVVGWYANDQLEASEKKWSLPSQGATWGQTNEEPQSGEPVSRQTFEKRYRYAHPLGPSSEEVVTKWSQTTEMSSRPIVCIGRG